MLLQEHKSLVINQNPDMIILYSGGALCKSKTLNYFSQLVILLRPRLFLHQCHQVSIFCSTVKAEKHLKLWRLKEVELESLQRLIQLLPMLQRLALSLLRLSSKFETSIRLKIVSLSESFLVESVSDKRSASVKIKPHPINHRMRLYTNVQTNRALRLGTTLSSSKANSWVILAKMFKKA